MPGPTQPPYIDINQPNFDRMLDLLNKYYYQNTQYAEQLQNISDKQLADVPPISFPTSTSTSTHTPTGSSDNDIMSIIDKSNVISTTKDIVNADTYELILQQNSMYIVGSIACASLIIGAIVMSKE